VPQTSAEVLVRGPSLTIPVPRRNGGDMSSVDPDYGPGDRQESSTNRESLQCSRPRVGPAENHVTWYSHGMPLGLSTPSWEPPCDASIVGIWPSVMDTTTKFENPPRIAVGPDATRVLLGTPPLPGFFATAILSHSRSRRTQSNRTRRIVARQQENSLIRHRDRESISSAMILSNLRPWNCLARRESAIISHDGDPGSLPRSTKRWTSWRG
jgi:hypothetical protein